VLVAIDPHAWHATRVTGRPKNHRGTGQSLGLGITQAPNGD